MSHSRATAIIDLVVTRAVSAIDEIFVIICRAHLHNAANVPKDMSRYFV